MTETTREKENRQKNKNRKKEYSVYLPNEQEYDELNRSVLLCLASSLARLLIDPSLRSTVN